MSIDPDSNRRVPETCAFIGRVAELPGSADSDFERSSGEIPDAPLVDGSQVQALWTEGVTWALETIAQASKK